VFIREAFDAWFETPTALTIERIACRRRDHNPIRRP
jgi:hypothetical protein